MERVNKQLVQVERVNKQLAEVTREVQALHIPVSPKICGEVRINQRAKSRFGCCKRETGRYIIEISESLLLCDETLLKQTLAHEILHTCEGCANHGVLWKEYAEKMNRAYGYNIQRTASHEDFEMERPQKETTLKYVLICASCGAQIKRSKLSKLVRYPHLYQCRCGGRLKRV